MMPGNTFINQGGDLHFAGRQGKYRRIIRIVENRLSHTVHDKKINSIEHALRRIHDENCKCARRC